ncbi:hypothetical protein D3C81_1510440 [compost metagenome]
MQHGVALLEQIRDLVGFKAEHNAFQGLHQEENAERADQRGEGQCPVDDPAAFAHHALNGVERNTESDHANLPPFAVVNRGKNPQRRG